MNSRFYWKGLTNNVENVVERCKVCAQLSKAVRYCPLKPIECKYPFELMSLDTGFVSLKNSLGETKMEYFLVAIDHFTCWVEVRFLASKKFPCYQTVHLG